jgi:hypothetical protein
MTDPCGWDDLPMPYEPVVNDNGIPMFEYLYPDYALPAYFSQENCLRLNPGYVEGILDPFDQTYFYGELIPPYIDQLGRGPNFRSADQFSLKYQQIAKCYSNTQRYGSHVYQRIAIPFAES